MTEKPEIIEFRYALRPGECFLCRDIINVGEPAVAGDEDDPYLHPDCLRREQEKP